MFKKVLIAPAAILLILFMAIASRPNAFRVERSIAIPVPSALVFPHVNDLHLWQQGLAGLKTIATTSR